MLRPSTIVALENSQREILSDATGIVDICLNFYQTLYVVGPVTLATEYARTQILEHMPTHKCNYAHEAGEALE